MHTYTIVEPLFEDLRYGYPSTTSTLNQATSCQQPCILGYLRSVAIGNTVPFRYRLYQCSFVGRSTLLYIHVYYNNSEILSYAFNGMKTNEGTATYTLIIII